MGTVTLSYFDDQIAIATAAGALPETIADMESQIDPSSQTVVLTVAGVGDSALAAARDGLADQALASAREARKGAVHAERERRVSRGLTYRFPDGLCGTVQMRHLEDLLNLQSLMTRAQLAVAEDEDTEIQFRDGENTNHLLAARDMIALARIAAAYREAVWCAAVQHKDAISELTTLRDIELYDVSSGWPPADRSDVAPTGS